MTARGVDRACPLWAGTGHASGQTQMTAEGREHRYSRSFYERIMGVQKSGCRYSGVFRTQLNLLKCCDFTTFKSRLLGCFILTLGQYKSKTPYFT